MPKDYKNAPPPRAERPPSHPLLLGMIIGLLLGIVISLAVALWLNRLSNPFVEKAQADRAAREDRAPRSRRKPEPRRGQGRREGRQGRGADKAAAKPRAPALRVLPDPAGREGSARTRRPRPPPPAPQGARRRAAAGLLARPRPRPSRASTYWLQAGAFSEEKEADNLKAKIALTGLEATVQAGRDTRTRGRCTACGWAPTRASRTRTESRAALSQNGVGAAIIRTTDEPKNHEQES